MQRVLVSVFGAIFVFAGIARAQTSDVPLRMTLDDALRLAAARNPTLAAARNVVEMAEGDRIGAELRPSPAMTLNGESYPVGVTPRPSFLNGQELTLRLDQEIETAGRRGLRLKAASQAVDGAEASYRNQWREIELDVKRAYFQVVLANADHDVANASLGEIDRVITLNRARLQQGEIAGAEVKRLQVERLKFVDDVFAAELATRNAKSALLALLNFDNLGTTFDVVDTLKTPDSPAPAQTIASDIGALGAKALASRSDLGAARTEATRADTETRLQRALRTPNVTVGGGYKRDFGTNSIVFGVTVPLPLFNRNAGGIARADAEARRAQNEVNAVKAKVLLDVQQASNAVDINRQRVAYIEREYLKTAQEARDIVLASYRLGAGDLINFLDAQRAYRETVRTYNKALYDLRISEYQLAAAVGTTMVQPQ